MSSKKMTKEEYITKENIFLNEVCKQHCMLCSAKKPEFCSFYFNNLGKDFLTNIIFFIKIARDRYPKLIDALKCIEGFSALFCNPDLCGFYSEHCGLRQKVSCYQMFAIQSEPAMTEAEEAALKESWNNDLERELCRELDNISKIMKTMPKKKKKRLNKIADRVMHMMSGWYHNLVSNDTAKSTTKESKAKVKKEVTTLIFYNDNEEWKNRIQAILEGRPVENIDRQPNNID